MLEFNIELGGNGPTVYGDIDIIRNPLLIEKPITPKIEEEVEDLSFRIDFLRDAYEYLEKMEGYTPGQNIDLSPFTEEGRKHLISEFGLRAEQFYNTSFDDYIPPVQHNGNEEVLS